MDAIFCKKHRILVFCNLEVLITDNEVLITDNDKWNSYSRTKE